MSEMIKIKTPSGFTAEVPREALDDMRLLDDFVKIDQGKVWYLGEAADKLLGADGKEKLYDFCKDPETQRVPATKVFQVMTELFNAIELKK